MSGAPVTLVDFHTGLIDLTWGSDDAPKVTLVGKGVCFDTGGLDIKPAAAMLTMKKDMGGAAHVLGLAAMVMDAQLPVRLRVLVPAVENAISGDAFRPVWKSTSASGAPDNSSLSHFSAMTRLSWLDRAVRNSPRHAVEQASRRWRGGRRDDSARTRRKI